MPFAQLAAELGVPGYAAAPRTEIALIGGWAIRGRDLMVSGGRYAAFAPRPPEWPVPVFRASNSSVPSAARLREGPTERLVGGLPAPPATPRRGVTLAVLLAVLALMAAAAAALMAWRALRLTADKPGSTPVPYAEEQLAIRAGCGAVTFLDLDEPRVGVSGDTGDLRYDSRCGPAVPALALGPGAMTLSDAGDARSDAVACGRAVRASPLGPGLTVPARKGVTLCVLTGGLLVRVVVGDVRPDGAATLRATAWSGQG